MGLVLWEIWTGARPWQPNETRYPMAYVREEVLGSASILDALNHHLEHVNRVASPEMPSYLREVVTQCLQHEPESRPPSYDLVRMLLDVQRRFWIDYAREQEMAPRAR